MSTGYTSDIAKGMNFETFVMRCARAFGALITMREDDWDAKIPDEIKPSDYYKEKLEEARNRLKKLKGLSLEKAAEEARRDFDAAISHRQERTNETSELRQKYENMLAQVRSWEPPTPDHKELKSFMAEQLTSSIRFDCGEYSQDDPVLLSPEAWLSQEIAKCMRDIRYHTEENNKEIERCKARTEWIKALKKSLH